MCCQSHQALHSHSWSVSLCPVHLNGLQSCLCSFYMRPGRINKSALHCGPYWSWCEPYCHHFPRWSTCVTAHRAISCSSSSSHSSYSSQKGPFHDEKVCNQRLDAKMSLSWHILCLWSATYYTYTVTPLLLFMMSCWQGCLDTGAWLHAWALHCARRYPPITRTHNMIRFPTRFVLYSNRIILTASLLMKLKLSCSIYAWLLQMNFQEGENSACEWPSKEHW